MSRDDLWLIAQEAGKVWCYPSYTDFVEVSFDAHLAIVRCMITNANAKAGWDKLGRYSNSIKNKKRFCREVIQHVVDVRCVYAISRREGKKDRVDRFTRISKAVSDIKSNLSNDGELFRACRLAQAEKNFGFAEQLEQAMAPHIERFASGSQFIREILNDELCKLLDDDPSVWLDIFNAEVEKLAKEPPLTTKMNSDTSEEIYFQKAMHKFWREKFDKDLHGVTADFSNAFFNDSVTEGKVRDRVNKK